MGTHRYNSSINEPFSFHVGYVKLLEGNSHIHRKITQQCIVCLQLQSEDQDWCAPGAKFGDPRGLEIHGFGDLPVWRFTGWEIVLACHAKCVILAGGHANLHRKT